MKTLPHKCATYNMADNRPILIVNGEMGYYPLSTGFDVEAYNKWLGIDEKDVEIMTAASMFGWDIPAVKNYEGMS